MPEESGISPGSRPVGAEALPFPAVFMQIGKIRLGADNSFQYGTEVMYLFSLVSLHCMLSSLP